GAFAGLAALLILASGFSAKVWVMVRELRGTAPTFYNKSVALVAEGKFNEALTAVDYALTLLPKEPDYHVLRGNILQSLLRLSAAQEAYQHSLGLEPGHKLAKENLALCQKVLRAAASAKEFSSTSLMDLHNAMNEQSRWAEG